ncbi:hypothetical protein BJV82DRAFT_577072 [Fennellomyces sp. T-0311]|nr:hypothetical protein BJV82DRAFT_577072 [Fennellomyces sp. T-0311]
MINITSKQVFLCSEYLTTAEAAALPLIGLTAYRAVFTKSQVEHGDYVLVTIFGDCCRAVTAVQFAVAAGAHVYVTSSSINKIEFAMKLGAEGGVNYNKREYYQIYVHVYKIMPVALFWNWTINFMDILLGL